MVQKKINSNTKNKKRKINNDTTRKMLTRSHYLFKQRLISKAREYPWIKVHIVTEEYTHLRLVENVDLLKRILEGQKHSSVIRVAPPRIGISMAHEIFC